MSVKCLDDCQNILQEITAAIDKTNPAMTTGIWKGVKTLVWPFKKKDTQSRIDRLQRYKQTFQLALVALNL